MNIKASGRSALIIAAGFWVCFSGPLQAAEDADGGDGASKAESAAGAPVALNKFVKHKSRHWKVASSHRKSVKLASKASSENSKAAATKKKAVEADAVMKDSESQPAIPPSVANANAQLAAADLPADTNSVSTKASNMLRTMAAKQADSADAQAPAPALNTELVAADQLNDVDRALSETKSEEKPALPPTVAMAMAQAPAAISNDDSTWGQTSLIGKIFIAFGGLLTLASAARMFMA
jgi:delta 1-pyrroline-5-carboxylate dehydrogenase